MCVRVSACESVRFHPKWPVMPWGKSSLNADVCANGVCVCERASVCVCVRERSLMVAFFLS